MADLLICRELIYQARINLMPYHNYEFSRLASPQGEAA